MACASSTAPHALRRMLRSIASVAVIASILTIGGAVPAGAHDGIAGSTPASGTAIEQPISTAEIDFGEMIGDDVSMFLVYDLGDGEIEELGGTTVKTGDTTARLDFDEIDREGTYVVRYLAPVPADGHVMSGAVSFTWGDPTSGSSSFPWVPFVGLATLILAIGAWFSYRRMLVPGEQPDASGVVDVPDTAL